MGAFLAHFPGLRRGFGAAEGRPLRYLRQGQILVEFCVLGVPGLPIEVGVQGVHNNYKPRGTGDNCFITPLF